MRLIDADAFVAELGKAMQVLENRKIELDKNSNPLVDGAEVCGLSVSYIGATVNAIAHQPTIDAVPVVHGHWIENENGTWSCNRCKSWIPNEQHYYARFCLHCGAKMDGKEQNDEQTNL